MVHQKCKCGAMATASSRSRGSGIQSKTSSPVQVDPTTYKGLSESLPMKNRLFSTACRVAPRATCQPSAMKSSSSSTDFEDNVAIYSILTPRDDQNETVVELKTAPPNFGNEILRARNDNHHDGYCIQLKHRDSDRDPEECLAWNDLLTSEKSAELGIPRYYECLAQPKLAALSNVHEVAFVTNYHLVKQGSVGMPNNLPDLALKLLYTANTDRATKYYITQGDLDAYFTKCNDSPRWRRLSTAQENYKLTEKAVSAIIDGTRAGFCALNKPFDSYAYKRLLELLVFRVSMPNVDELREINLRLLKVYLPFYKNLLSEHYGEITEEFMHLFETTERARTADKKSNGEKRALKRKCLARKTTVGSRYGVLSRLAKIFKKNISMGSLNNYETDVLMRHWENLNLEKSSISETLDLTLYGEISNCETAWKDKTPRQVINVYSHDSNTTVLALQIFSNLKISENDKENAWRTVIVQVQEEAGIERVVQYFKELGEDASECKELISVTFCCVIEVSPLFQPADAAGEHAKKLIRSLTEMSELRKWIQFVVLTKSPVPDEQLNNFNVEDPTRSDTCKPCVQPSYKGVLLWQGLPEDGKKYLLRKTLYLENGKQTSLEKLGFQEGHVGDWLLHPKPLAELIIHDKEKPLSLGLPKNDPDLRTAYVERIACSKDSCVTIEESKLLEDFDNNNGTESRNSKLLVIVDDPGKGKSCLLTSLSNRFLDEWDNELPHRLLLRVDLLRVNDWDAYQNSPVDFFLRHSLRMGTGSNKDGDNLNFAIVREKCLNSSEPGVFVLLDGLNEVSNEWRQAALKMIDDLLNAKGIKRIILTSRPFNTLEDELEQHFSQSSLHLKSFDRKDQINYLTNRWKSELKKHNELEGSGSNIEMFVDKLVDYAKEALHDEGKAFLETPLQCWILSVGYFVHLEQYLARDSTPRKYHKSTSLNLDDIKFELCYLYDRFFEVKFEALFEEKTELQSKNKASHFINSKFKLRFLKSLMRLSVFHLMKRDDAQLLCHKNWEDYCHEIGDEKSESKYSNDLKIAMSLGLVRVSESEKSLSKIEPQNVIFLHRTFAEYFFAKFLFRHFIETKSKLLDNAGTWLGLSTKSNEEIEVEELYLKNKFKIINETILVSSEFTGVRRFLDRMLKVYVPPIGERCPFAEASRETVLRDWPIIGHAVFNECIAKFAISQISTNSTGLLCEDLRAVEERKTEPEMGLAGILHGNGDKLPSITSMLIHCIREYACRHDTRDNEREKLAFWFTLASLKWVSSCDESSDRTRKSLMKSVLYSFSRMSELSLEANNIFSKWLQKLVNEVADPSNREFKLEALALTHEILNGHTGGVTPERF